MKAARFWSLIESCRSPAASIDHFNSALERAAEKLPLVNLAGLHQCVWDDIGRNTEELAYVLNERIEVGYGGDTWDCYGCWLIAQGRQFRELVARDPAAALTRIPTIDECLKGETVLFMATRVCHNLTGQLFHELFGDHLEHVSAVSDELADRETLTSLHEFLDIEYGRSMAIRHINRFGSEFSVHIGADRSESVITLQHVGGEWTVAASKMLRS